MRVAFRKFSFSMNPTVGLLSATMEVHLFECNLPDAHLSYGETSFRVMLPTVLSPTLLPFPCTCPPLQEVQPVC